MKTISALFKGVCCFPLLTALTALGMPSFASADIVNIDINNGTVYQGLAAAPDSAGTSAVWNGVGNGTSTGLLDSNNVATSVGVNLNGGTIFNGPRDQEITADLNGGAASTFADLQGDYFGLRAGNNGADLRTSNITGLVAGNAYDLYLYAQGDNFIDTNNNGGQNTGFRIGTDVRHTSYDGTVGGDGLLVEDVEYVLFTGIVADAAGSITFEHFNPGTGVHGTDPAFFDSDTGSADLDGNNSRFHGLNGIQIVGNFTAVPEPSSLVITFGIAGLVAVRRRRKS